MGNPLKRIACHFTSGLFILSVVQISFFYSLPKQVLGCSYDFLNTKEKFQLVIVREKRIVYCFCRVLEPSVRMQSVTAH